MNAPHLKPAFRNELREALVRQVNESRTRHRRAIWRRRQIVGGTFWVLAAAGGGAAVASGLVPLSFQAGQPYDVALSPDVSADQVGPIALSVTDTPQGANGIQLLLSCQDPGTLELPGGAKVICTAEDGSSTAMQVLDLPSPRGAITIDAPRDMRWKLQYTWLMRTQTEWRKNASGETFGSTKPDNSQPDLLATIATNGAQGYIRTSQYEELQALPKNPDEAVKWMHSPEQIVVIPVYASDGITVVGKYEVKVKRPL